MPREAGEDHATWAPVERPDGWPVRGDPAVLTERIHNQRAIEVVWRRIRVPGRVVMHCGQGRDGALWLLIKTR